MRNTISGFFGPYRFLSNFWWVDISYEGVVYPTVEHAYVAAKTLDLAQRQRVFDFKTPGQVKKYKPDLRPNWDSVKLSIMLSLLRQKFSVSYLRKALFDTGSAELVEENDWGDTYWGVSKGRGANHLGRLLMQVRAEIGKGGKNDENS